MNGDSNRSREATAHQTTAQPETDDRFAVPLCGVAVDSATRCRHWHEEVDVIALRFACCETYYPCISCHHETADHEPERWPGDRFGEPAVLCGVCRTTLTAEVYFDCADTCPACGVSFNPGCRTHRHLYFEP